MALNYRNIWLPFSGMVALKVRTGGSKSPGIIMYNIAMDIHEVLEKETQNINMLSGGEKQKVELVKTILKDADVYFFDEPTAHLDQESRDEYYQYLKKQKDKIIVVVSHNSQERQYFDVIYEV